VKNGDNLFDLSNEREQYKSGYVVNEINAEDRYVEFSNGNRLELGATQGGYQDDIMKVQIRKAVEEHFRKEAKLKPLGIKVLTLFFIDKVKNYRVYEAGSAVKGKFAEWFEQIYHEFARNKEYRNVIPFPVGKVHDGYFAQDKKGLLKDSREGKPSEDDASAYHLIMQNKERLLDAKEPLRFIFSHSALREGWDNPNVFQLCTLNETKSELKKRQEIGRGLRLAVNAEGNRVFDKSVNRLTVVANESYEDFAKQLQKEIEEDTGEKFEGRIKKKEDKVQIRLKKGYDTDRSFLELWDRIRQKATYRVQYSSDALVHETAKRVRHMEQTIAPRIITQRTQVVMENTGISGATLSTRVHNIESYKVDIPDLLGYVQSKTELTRSTIVRILEESGRLSDCLKNPQIFLDNVIREIKAVLNAMMVEGVKYLKVGGERYEMRLFEDGEIEAYLENLYTVRKQEKTLYNYIEIDSLSGPEQRFAKDCEDNEDVEFFIKLPRKFVIKTPIGEYRPDWALVFKGEKKLYFVAETKSGTHEGDMRSKEWQKIVCSYRHFDEFPEVEFKHVKELRELQS
jgi:type III restriction enzyme